MAGKGLTTIKHIHYIFNGNPLQFQAIKDILVRKKVGFLVIEIDKS